MKTVNLKQGTPEWLEFRKTAFTASEAAAMMGCSPYQSRLELLKQKFTGIAPEVNGYQQKIFDNGHRVEAAARPIIEAELGEDLYPVTGYIERDGLKLSASFDGLNLDESLAWEHKQYSLALAMNVESNILEDHYIYQLEQQLLVSGADKVIFTTSDGTSDNMESMEYYSKSEYRNKLIAGWKQFSIDLESYQLEPEKEAIQAQEIKELPALDIQLEGSIKSSNLAVYKATALDFFSTIKTDLVTDADFVDAGEMVKFCARLEKELSAGLDSALKQTADINELIETVKQVTALSKKTRLYLDKQVKSEKQKRKAELVAKYHNDLQAYINGLNSELAPYSVDDSMVNPDFNGAIKGKKTLDSMEGSLHQAATNAKIELETMADTMRFNIEFYNNNVNDYQFLFMDIDRLLLGETESFKDIIQSRIYNHQQKEIAKAEAKAEAERLAAEKEAKRAENEERRKAAAVSAKEAEALKRANQALKESTECLRSVAEPQTELSAPVLVHQHVLMNEKSFLEGHIKNIIAAPELQFVVTDIAAILEKINAQLGRV